MGELLCVTGTGTDVGKTYASSVLLHLLKHETESVGYYKPYQTGVYFNESGTLTLPDVEFVKNNTPVAPKDIHTAYALSPPLSPYHAAIKMGKTITADKVLRDTKKLADEYSYLVLEGAGGLYVPILEDYFFLDLFCELGGEIVLVADIGLGTLNHTMLSVESIYNAEQKVKMVLLSNCRETEEEADKLNVEYLRKQLYPTPVIEIPHLTKETMKAENFPHEKFIELRKAL